MSGTEPVAHYLDTSALVKLVVAEPESTALQGWLAARPDEATSSDLARTELLRAVRRAAPDRLERARRVLDSLTLLVVPTDSFEEAGRLAPVTMRSLDALHLAAAVRLGDDLDAIVTYDERLAEAARLNGLPAVAPA